MVGVDSESRPESENPWHSYSQPIITHGKPILTEISIVVFFLFYFLKRPGQCRCCTIEKFSLNMLNGRLLFVVICSKSNFVCSWNSLEFASVHSVLSKNHFLFIRTLTFRSVSHTFLRKSVVFDNYLFISIQIIL